MSVYVYCDESGKHRDHPVIAFGALVGDAKEIAAFEKEWKYCLGEVGLNCLTMKQALDLGRPLGTANGAQGENSRVVALLPFVDCMKKHLRLITGCAVDVGAFNRMSQEAQKQLTKNPQYVAFARVVIESLAEVAEGEHLSIVCDDEQEVAIPIYKLYRKIKICYPVVNKRVASLSLADDEVFCPLQAADMVASLLRIEGRRQFLGEQSYAHFLFERLVSKLEVRPQAGVRAGFYNENNLQGLSQSFVDFEQKYGRYGVAPLVEEKGSTGATV